MNGARDDGGAAGAIAGGSAAGPDGPDAAGPVDATITAATTTGAGLAHDASPGDAADAASDAITAGERVGRYTVLEPLGRGGMGVVYKAYDPVLDRAIAIKMLHGRSISHESRLLREAQVLARLSHPNVLTVYETAVHDDRTFLAIELVDGTTLDRWLAAARRSRAEILETFDAAGRGLAAAHAAGIVHRDFKPTNVLVGRDGRVRVSDFGIARGSRGDDGSRGGVYDVSSDSGGMERLDSASAATEAQPASAAAASPMIGHPSTPPMPRSVIDSPMTATGALIGTPAYMAPEQAIGERADPRSDQFSFCVALWEALTGKRPFSGRTPAGRAEQVARGELADPRSGASLPRALRRALLRGLAFRREDRFPSMLALLAALSPPVRRRWVLAAALLTGALALGGIAVFRDRPAAAPTCVGFDAELAGVWDAKARSTLETTFARVPGADWPRAAALVDRWTTDWVAARTDACSDTLVRGGQSEAAMDRRMACLDRRLVELSAVTRLLREGHPDVVVHATDAALALTAPTTCDRAELLTDQTAAATDGARAARAAVEHSLADTKALYDAGRHQDGMVQADPLIAAARAAGAHDLAAEGLLLRGRLQRQLGVYPAAVASFSEASREAELAGTDRLRLEIALRALDVVGPFLEDRVHAAWLADTARGIAAGLGDPPELIADIAEVRSTVELRFGHLDEARRLAEEMLALRRGRVAPDSPDWARTLRVIARATQLQGELELTAGYLDEALAIMERHVGPDHPFLFYYLHNLGLLQRQRGQLDDAERTIRRCIALAEAAWGKENGNVGRSSHNLGDVLRDGGRPAESLAALERALAIHSTAVGPTSLPAAEALSAIARTLLDLGRTDEAWTRGQRALAIYRTQPDNRGIAEPLDALARIAVARGELPDALALADEAVTVASAKGGEAPTLVAPLTTRGEVRLAAGQGDAAADLERALGILAHHPQAPMDHARTEAALARAVLDQDPARARALATAARDRLGLTGAAGERRKQLDAWLQAH